MGLAASQARLLLLTARKSDLEYRAQMICQRKTMLAMQTEELATNYSRALNDRKLYFTYYANSNEGVAKETLLTYEDFTSAGNTTRYRLIDAATGEVVALNEKDAEKYINTVASVETTTMATTQADTATAQTDTAAAQTDTAAAQTDTAAAQTDTAAATATAATATQPAVGTKVKTPTETINISYAWANVLKNPEGLQNAIQSGALLIQKMEVTGDNEVEGGNSAVITTWKYVALSGMEDVRSKLYTDNDAAASAEYEYQSLIIQNQDKQLDVELKQVETQQKACETEIDSVKKVMDKNIEHSFKTFG